jgi:hypothetical protein
LSEKKPIHEQMTTKNNGLSSMQEVVYQEEFKKADKVIKSGEKKDKENKKS